MFRKILSLGLFVCAAVQVQAVDPPVMGWSSWNTYRVNISDSLIMRQADALVSKGLLACGYRYVNIDDGYFGGRDAQGCLFAHPQRFPQGLRPVVEHIHRLGLKAGIYSDVGRNTCGSYWDKDTLGVGVGLYGHDEQDARLFFDSLRFDFIKIDFCGGDAKQNFDHLALSERERYTAIRQAIDATGRTDVRLNICRWAFPGTWVSEVGSSWRISPDINDSWQSVKSIIAANRNLSAYATGGSYNDMDMLEIGRGLSEAEERTHFGMWCMFSSPLLIGCDLTTIPDRSLQLLTNPDLIAIDQDVLGRQASVVRDDSGVLLVAKDLLKDDGLVRAVALCNTTDQVRTATFHFREVLLGGRIQVYDAFSHSVYAEAATDSLTILLQPHDTRIFRLTATARIPRTVYEATTAWLNRYQKLGMNPTLGYADYMDDAACTAGAKVGYLGNHPDNWLEWRGVNVPHEGKYELRFHVQTNDERSMYYQINGGKRSILRVQPQTTVVKLKVRLKAGHNVVRLGNDHAWTPDIESMEVVPLR